MTAEATPRRVPDKNKYTAYELDLIQAAKNGTTIEIWLTEPCDDCEYLPNPRHIIGIPISIDRYAVKLRVNYDVELVTEAADEEDTETRTKEIWIAKSIMGITVVDLPERKPR